MGLDITYYRKLSPIAATVNPETGEAFDLEGKELEWSTWFQPNHNHHFPGRMEGLSDGVYSFEEKDGFRAGSYSGYNLWREQLAKLAGYPQAESERNGPRHDSGAWQEDSGPFWELISFSDCEGTIGPTVAAKIAKDFADHQEAADAHEDERFRRLYSEWREAFEYAADGGAVDFH